MATSRSTTRRLRVSTRPSRSSASIQGAAATNGEAESARAEQLQQLVDAGYTNVVAVGFAYAKSVGAGGQGQPDRQVRHRRRRVARLEGPNVDQITFAEEQGSYLVGAAAALKSKVNHIGFVGGVNTDLIKKFQAGYQAGAKAVNPNIVIDVKYLTEPPDFSGFNSVDKGKAAAEGMYQGGADIVYQAAGGSVAASSPRPRRRASSRSASTPTRPRRRRPTSATSS